MEVSEVMFAIRKQKCNFCLLWLLHFHGGYNFGLSEKKNGRSNFD